MIFTYKVWSGFCRGLHSRGIHSIPAREVTAGTRQFLVLKHDVETDVRRAYDIARIEQRFGHRGSYYVQVYLLDRGENVELLKKMSQMGHEISYHYDVLDSCGGDMTRAAEEFEENRKKFESCGFPIRTVCQHGNPVVARVGYTSNRDFFRSQRIRDQYPGIADIMVNYKQDLSVEYLYFSDAGRKFQLIHDPVNNDIENSDHLNVPYSSLDGILRRAAAEACIISIHPHRWTKSAVACVLKIAVFRVIRAAARLLQRIPALKRLMSRYYYLAKKL